MKHETTFVQNILQSLADLDEYEHQLYTDLVLLTRSEHLPAISLQSVAKLSVKGFITEYDVDNQSIQLNEEVAEILRIDLGESEEQLRQFLRRISAEFPNALADLHRAITTMCSLNMKYVQTLQFYHLVYQDTGVYYPLSLLYDMEDEIEQLTKQPWLIGTLIPE